ncbi:MAG TPA: c-type cytochrome [Myxococcaceae bacterium]|nr:c-type cytochrome [Myxococcaceae bacterium]
MAGLFSLGALALLGLSSACFTGAKENGYGIGRTATPEEVAGAREHYGFGRLATPAEIAAWDIDVRPDGQGLPKGSGSVEEGEELYEAQCASCHGSFGDDNRYMPIAGGVQEGDIERGRASILASAHPVRSVGTKLNYVTTLWDYINRAMPFNAPKTLTPNEVYAITAYVLYLNEIVPEDTTLDEKSLLEVKMPNRDGFTTRHGFMTKDGEPDVKNVACMKNCATEVTITSELPEFAAGSHGDLTEQLRTFAPTTGPRKAGAAAAPSASASGYDLAKKAACIACHGVSNKLVGPAFRDIGAKYKDRADAESNLVAKARAGGAGAWGPVPMPPQTHVSEEDVKTIVQWILAGSPTE